MSEEKILTETQIALERANDTDFEQIVCSHVRRSNPERYSTLIHLGTNQEGKPIQSKVDGFCPIPNSSPPRYVQVAITTTKLDNLKGKWFSESKDKPGDLVKARNEAEMIRHSYPDAKFELILATNRKLSESFIKETVTFGKDWFKVIPIEQTQLVDFLDNSPDGQYLRQKYFGIPVKRLSIDLLREIGHKTLKLHANVFKIPELDQRINRETSDPTRLKGNLTILLGNSGYGKSTTANQLLKSYLDMGEISVWIPAKFVEASPSLLHAIASVLQENAPGLSFEEAMRVFDLVSNSGLTLFILVDDINRTENPQKVINELFQSIVLKDNASNSSTSDGGQKSSSRDHKHLILPIWRSFWQLRQNEINDTDKYNIINIERYTKQEINSLSKIGLRQGFKMLEMEKIAGELAYDPYLIGLKIKSFSLKSKYSDTPSDPWTIQEDFLNLFLNDIISRNSELILLKDLIDTLMIVAAEVIHCESLSPNIENIERSAVEIGTDISKEIRILLRDGNIIGIESNGEINFRHDRLRDFLVARFIVNKIERRKSDIEAISSTDWFSDPKFAFPLGLSLLKVKDDIVDIFIKSLSDRNPLALAFAVQYSFMLRENIKGMLSNSLNSMISNTANKKYPNSLHFAILLELNKAQSPLVKEILKNSNHGIALHAKFRNGDLFSGISYLDTTPSDFPGCYTYEWDNAVSEHLSVTGENSIELLAGLIEGAQDPKRLPPLLNMAGFYGSKKLSESIKRAWLKFKSKEILFSALWAALRCHDSNDSLELILIEWAKLPVPKKENEKDEAFWIGTYLGHAGYRGYPDEAINSLLNFRKIYPSLESPIIEVVIRLDHPLAALAIASKAAEIDKDLKPGQINMYSIRAGSHGIMHKYCEITRDVLLNTWLKAEKGLYRMWAFRFWSDGAKQNEIETLQKIDAGDELFFPALLARATFKDYSAAEQLLKKLNDRPDLIRFLGNIVTDEIEGYVSTLLDKLKIPDLASEDDPRLKDSVYDLNNFLKTCPSEVAERLILPRYDTLRHYPLIIQAALLRDTDKLLNWANRALSESDRPHHVFQYFFLRQRFDGRLLQLSDRIIEIIKNFKDLVEKHDLTGLAEELIIRGQGSWVEHSIKPLLIDKNRLYLFPTDDEIIEKLNLIITDDKAPLNFKIHNYIYRISRTFYVERVLKLLPKWLSMKCSKKHLKLAAEIISYFGAKSDLKILKNVSSDDDDYISYLISDASFRISMRPIYPQFQIDSQF